MSWNDVKNKIRDRSGASEFISDCDDLLALLDELPERAEDFTGGVREKVESMKQWAEEHDRATDRMVEALANMRAGAERWSR